MCSWSLRHRLSLTDLLCVDCAVICCLCRPFVPQASSSSSSITTRAAACTGCGPWEREISWTSQWVSYFWWWSLQSTPCLRKWAKGEGWIQLLMSACGHTDVRSNSSTGSVNLLLKPARMSDWRVTTAEQFSVSCCPKVTGTLLCLCRGISVLDVERPHVSSAVPLFWPCKFTLF